MALGLVNCTELDHHDPTDPYPKPVCPGRHECSSVGYSCEGSISVICYDDFDGCYRRGENVDCAEIDATCVDGLCRFQETCPEGVASFCRNGHVLYCPLEPGYYFYDCGDNWTCQETIGADELKHAVCATNDAPCQEREVHNVECRGDESFACSYGLVMFRNPCKGCNLDQTDAGLPLVTCK
jgi:hypothetical protein